MKMPMKNDITAVGQQIKNAIVNMYFIRSVLSSS